VTTAPANNVFIISRATSKHQHEAAEMDTVDKKKPAFSNFKHTILIISAVVKIGRGHE
jgi:hypothetical protein